MASEKRIYKQVVSAQGFSHMNPNNFTATWMDITFGVLDGRPFITEKFTTRASEDEWLDAECNFMRSMIERIEAYRASRGK